MTLPAGVTACTVTLSRPKNSIGTEGDLLEVTIVADRRLVWTATGETLYETADTITPAAGTGLSFVVPHVDQAGWTDRSGAAITEWSYTLKYKTLIDGVKSTYSNRKRFQVFVGQTTIDADLLPDGAVTSAVTAPAIYVATVAGLPGPTIDAEELAGELDPFITGGGGGAGTWGSITGTLSAQTDLQSALDAKATAAALTSHTGNTSNPHSVTKAQVGLGSVDNTADTAKPVSTAQQTALDLKAPLASPTFTGTVSGVTKSHVGLGNADNTSDANKPVSTATQTALDLKAPIASPTFTGTVGGVTKSMVGLANVDNTADASKPVSTAQAAADTAVGSAAASALSTHTSDTANPHAVTKSQVGLANADNTSDASKPVSTATQTALDLKAPLASPTFTGTVAGVTKGHVGLGNVDNTADTAKPVSTAQQTALDLKVPTSRTLTAGNGLTGLGDLSADRTPAVALTNTSAVLGADVTVTANTTTTILTTPSLAVGTWMVYSTVTLTAAATASHVDIFIAAGTATATFAGAVSTTLRPAVSAAYFQAVVATIVTVTVAGTVLIRGKPGAQAYTAKWQPANAGPDGATGLVAYRIA